MAAVRLGLILVLAALSGVASAASLPAPRHHQAILANTAGLRLFRSGQLSRAALRFRDALAFDPDYVLAHYNLACASSRLRETGAALDELRWLAASSDPLAKAKLDKALSDPDLDFVSALPAVRTMLSLAPFDGAHPMAWLAERGGVWSAELPRADCAQRSYSFVLHSGGELELTVREQCSNAAPLAHTFTGSLQAGADGIVRIEVPTWAQWPRAVRLTFAPCPGLDAPGSCFVLDAGEVELGPFHRGVAGMSPLRARSDLASAKMRP